MLGQCLLGVMLFVTAWVGLSARRSDYICTVLKLYLTAEINLGYICCGSISSLVQILFPLFQTHYHQITITKTKEIKFEPRIKLNHNIYMKVVISITIS